MRRSVETGDITGIVQLNVAGEYMSGLNTGPGAIGDRARNLAHTAPKKHDDQSAGLLNVRKTAGLLDVHPNTLRNWTNQGLIPCYTINARGDRRFKRQDIEEFLAQHRKSAAPV